MKRLHIYHSPAEVINNYAAELVAKEYTHAIDWTSVYFFFGDERYVLSNDPDSNALMAKEALFNPLNIQENQVFTVDTTLEVKMVAADYNKKIVQFFDGQKIAFDLVMLGLGDDAHTASLFPGTEVLNEEMSGVSHVYISEKDVFRITMTAQMINDANNIAFLVFGKNKAEAVQHVMEGEQKTSHYPAQLIDKKAEWFMDEAAAKLITV